MNEHRRQILNMLAAGKITAEEAERLITAVESNPAAHPAGASGNGGGNGNTPYTGSFAEPVKKRVKYLRVLVEAMQGAPESKRPTSVNIRVPMQLLRAGVRLASLVPIQAHEQIDEAFRRHGLPLTLSQIKPENLEELVEQLEDLTIDVASQEKHQDVKVRVFCE
jgi:hypothetical protein